MSKSLEKIDAVILCGGLGTRLRPVLGNEIPKVLAPLGEKILLDITLERLREAGFKRTNQIASYFGKGCSFFRGRRAIGHWGRLEKSVAAR